MRHGFPNRIEKWRRGLGLIKVSMIYLYIKPKVRKNHTTEMTINKVITATTAINEACIG